MKLCNTCKENKSTNEFSKDSKHLDGLKSNCKACTSAYYKGYNASRKALKAQVVHQSKVCRECGLEKPISQFGSKNNTLDKHNIYCKPCWRKRCSTAMRKKYYNDKKG